MFRKFALRLYCPSRMYRDFSRESHLVPTTSANLRHIKRLYETVWTQSRARRIVPLTERTRPDRAAAATIAAAGAVHSAESPAHGAVPDLRFDQSVCSCVIQRDFMARNTRAGKIF